MSNSPLIQKKRNNLLYKCAIVFFVFLMSVAIFSSFVPASFAGSSDDDSYEDIKAAIKDVAPDWNEGDPLPFIEMYESLGLMQRAAFSWAEAVYEGGVYDETVTKYLVLRLPDENTVLEDIKDNYFMTAVGTISNVLPVAMSLGIGLLCIWFFTDLIGKATADSFTVEHFVKSLMKFVAGYLVISNLININENGAFTGLVPTVINGTADIVESLKGAGFSSGEITLSSPLVSTWYKLYTEYWTAALSVIIDLLLPSIFSTLARVLIRAFALGRIIELAILVLFSPVAVSNIFGDISHDQNYGIKYIKKLAAIELQGLIMYYIILLGTNIQGSMNGANLIGVVAVTCVEAALIARSRNVATEILGVH